MIDGMSLIMGFNQDDRRVTIVLELAIIADARDDSCSLLWGVDACKLGFR